VMKLLKSLIKEEKGQGLVEYALIIALIAIAAIIALEALGGHISGIFQKIKTDMSY
jgi:pilus assembly protein Flp/PilA